MKRSVAVTTYNSASFVKEQLDSVLCELDEGDEVVISADPSHDGTEKILSAYARKDSRIRIVQGSGRGLIQNFENAVSHCTGDIIFLCDHDDVWLPGKVDKVTAAFADPKVLVVLHDAKVCTGNLDIIAESYMAWHKSKAGYRQNLLRNSFIGCCMAFRREMLQWILPFPPDLPMHDQWIGLLGYRHGKVAFLQEALLLYRRHGNNMSSTKHAGFARMLRWRLALLKNLSKHR